MIGLDTNVVIRYLVQDDAKQSPRATAFVEKELSETRPGLLTHIVLCEIAWVLEDVYGLSYSGIAEVLEGLFSARQITLQDAHLAWQALRQLQGGADFSDALIGLTAMKLGCDRTVTFDKAAAKLDGFDLLRQ